MGAPPTPTTTPPAQTTNCVDDAEGILAQWPMTCTMVLSGQIGITGGCDAQVPAIMSTFLFKGVSVPDLCPMSCKSECQQPQPEVLVSAGGGITQVLVCNNDPRGILAAMNTNCGEMLLNLGGCHDSDGAVHETLGAHPSELCPENCDP